MAHSFSPARRSSPWIAPLCVLLLCGVAAALTLWGIRGIASRSEEEKLRRSEEAILHAAVSCYAIEGFYPPDLAYLEEHYGVLIDRKSYLVYYDLMGSNILPSVQVVPLGGGKSNGGS